MALSLKIYAIVHDATGKRYIGSTQQRVFYRISTHLGELRRGIHASPKFQELWNSTDITKWSFKVLEILPYGTMAIRLRAEKRHIDSCPPDLCLNDRINISFLDRHQEAVALLRQGKTGREIRGLLGKEGLSEGMISRIRHCYITEAIM
jgi:hypothetical protein